MRGSKERLNEHRSDRTPSTRASIGTRALAAFEAAKGVVVLLLACGVLDLVHKNLDQVAERLAKILHFHPGGKLSRLFEEVATDETNGTLLALAAAALIYAAVRLVLSYGLWRDRPWAQWVELLWTGLYLPPELYWLLHHPSWVRGAVFVMNIVILLFLLTLRLKAVRRLV